MQPLIVERAVSLSCATKHSVASFLKIWKLRVQGFYSLMNRKGKCDVKNNIFQENFLQMLRLWKIAEQSNLWACLGWAKEGRCVGVVDFVHIEANRSFIIEKRPRLLKIEAKIAVILKHLLKQKSKHEAVAVLQVLSRVKIFIFKIEPENLNCLHFSPEKNVWRLFMLWYPKAYKKKCPNAASISAY